MRRSALLLLLAACGDDGSGSADTEAPGASGDADSEVTNLAARLDDDVLSVVWVSWNQRIQADRVRVDYAFEDGDWRSTPSRPGTLGAHEQIVLGVPYGYPLSWRVVSEVDGVESAVDGPGIETGAAPASLPELALDVSVPGGWDPADQYLLTSTSGEMSLGSRDPGFHVVLVDREGRYVWALPAHPESWTFFPKVSRGGDAILYDDSLFWTQFDGGLDGKVKKVKLDGSLVREWATPGLHHAFDDLSDDTLAWNGVTGDDDQLHVTVGDGEPTVIWTCLDWIAEVGITATRAGRNGEQCGSNALSWNPDRGTYVLSLWSHETVLEVDDTTGEVQWYAAPHDHQGYLVPEDATWHWQHEAHLVADDRLLLSSGVEGSGTGDEYVATAAYEYAIDRSAGALSLVWSYQTEPDWASQFKGGAHRLANGNTVHEYGDFGGVREITPEGEVVWQLRFDEGSAWLGRATFVGDLYALAP